MRKTIATVMTVGILAIAFHNTFIVDDRGKIIYRNHCGACHARGLGNAPKFGNEDEWASRIAKGIDALYASAWNGLDGMPPKGGKADASKDDIEAAVDYMVSNSGG
uniref:Cytochrome C oxidase, cbb3-type, subunit III n=1 Tax=Candidatus Kentrum sp. TC TaxID=2126339 RepID=A0A451AEY9_9GAMM|nr:MAG: Cytochrome C oxidase, cbb3-type, subunit III [Candidatus Kentron sp. TC]VFK52347.1 MAG: Cytochrome C oxidase, cbb3-type, subunit III [Candidatus Kentron sp. TC]VFK64617.1 MAG: Cytochrome C oxidase, cbb3-type, subunit III [Candidatus Kentron sp. TC]